jgi:hypothetical protein
MCLIIHQPRGHTVPRARFFDIADRNADGFGFMFANRGELVTWRTVDGPEVAYAEYLRRVAGREAVLHWRMTTHGATNEENAHPFCLGASGVALVHNGMLDIGTPHRGMSDTWHLANLLTPVALAGRIMDPDMVEMLRGLIGSGNKVALMDHTGAVVIAGRDRGVEHKGVWYSNTYGWDAPSSLLVKQYGTTKYWRGKYAAGWGDGSDDEGMLSGGDVTKALPASGGTSTVTAVPTTDSVTPTDSDGLLFGELRDDVTRYGAAGALDWALAHPSSAARVLALAYDIGYNDAEDLVYSSPDVVAESLVEIVEQDDLEVAGLT